jgi:hypothetical protein
MVCLLPTCNCKLREENKHIYLSIYLSIYLVPLWSVPLPNKVSCILQNPIKNMSNLP